MTRWKQVSSNTLVVSAFILAAIATFYGFLAGEWRAAGLLGFAAAGFWLGAQELQSQ